MDFLEALEIARKAVDTASDKQATDIILLDTKEICGFSDYFVICTSETSRQTRAIADEIQNKLKKEGVLPLHLEGTSDSGWLLLDYGDVIIHIFASAERDYYQLERLWDKAKTVVRIQ